MREIKFRAWDSFNECYYYSDEERFPSLAAFFIHVKFCEDGGNGILIEQYTGLKDKNGVEIYEGDILLHKGAKGVVVYDNSIAMFMIHFDLLRSIYSFDSIDGKIEVIGNIHSNTELLK